jgi:hypothetical protein
MKKISTLFKKDINDLSRVIPEVDPENIWVYDSGIPTRKFDGSACAIIDGLLYKRYDVKKGRTVPEEAIPCQELDKKTGHWPHWVLCVPLTPADKYFLEAFDNCLPWVEDGTYELCGEKVQGNPEKIKGHKLIKHGSEVLPITNFSFESIREYLSSVDIEGIVFHDKNSDRMCKIRKSDFGLRRQP